MTSLTPELVARRSFDAPCEVACGPRGTWVVSTPTELVVVDRLLNDLATFPLAANAKGSHAVAPDLSCAAVCSRHGADVVDGEGRILSSIRFGDWDRRRGSACVTGDGLVWVMTTGSPTPDWLRDPAASERWLVASLTTGEVLDWSPLPTAAEGSHTCLHPDERRVGLSVGEGQDGSPSFLGSRRADGLDVRAVGDGTRLIAGFSPDGSRIVTTPHDDGPLEILDVESLSLLASLPRGEAFCFSYVAGWLTAGLIVASTASIAASDPGCLVLDGVTLEILADVTPPGWVGEGYPFPDGKGTWAMVDHQAGDVRTWQLPQGWTSDPNKL